VFPTPPPSQRLVTQNLLLSASCALIHPTPIFVRDLATIINLACLYDDLLLPAPRTITVTADLLTYLQAEKLLRPAMLTSTQWQDAITRADAHLALAAKGQDHASSKDAFALASNDNVRGQTLNPDGIQDAYLAREAIKTVTAYELHQRLRGTDHDRRIAGYALRTFLYLGIADELLLPVTSDAARKDLLGLIARREQDYIRQQIIDLLGASAANDLSLSPTVRAISAPLAAIVFHRAKTSAQIIPELHRLRTELKALRHRLRPWEEKRRTGVGRPRDKAINKLNRALDELAAKYHLKRQAFTTTDFVHLGANLAPIMAAPQNPAAWLPLTATTSGGLLKWQERRFFVELHHEYDHIPSSAAQDEDLRRLFNL
jgi:hypothetical protein